MSVSVPVYDLANVRHDSGMLFAILCELRESCRCFAHDWSCKQCAICNFHLVYGQRVVKWTDRDLVSLAGQIPWLPSLKECIHHRSQEH